MDASRDQPTLTFLMADIRGYTAFTAEHGDVAGSRLVAEFATITAECVEAWSGRLLELRGDEALCAFDDHAAALRAAVELQDAFDHARSVDPPLPLLVGIGLAAGEAVALGDGFRGSTLNLAARLCSVSAAGEIHASPSLIGRVQRVEGLGFEEVSDLQLKGFGSGQRAYRVRPLTACASVSPQPVTSSPLPEALPEGLDTSGALIGRDAEMRCLRWHWRRARSGHSRTVMVDGAPGVGKTRLVAELAAHAQAIGASVGYATRADDGSMTSGSPGGPEDRPRLQVIDAGDAWVPPLTPPADDAMTAHMNVAIRNVGHEETPSDRVSRDGAIHLQVRPLGLDGIRALAMELRPETADELPIARILETSGGLPGPARVAVSEWSERILAERAAGHDAGSIPAEPSSFVGRGHELERLGALLEHTRLLTLTGPPGTGKTRLAIQLARALADGYADGAVFVPLASLRDETLVGSALAHALQLRESPEASPLDVVRAYLSERHVLLVLDNFEHLAGAAADVGRVLAASPHVRIVVTSRSALELSGEQVYPVPPLAVPPADGTAEIEVVAACDAAVLFALRARAVDPAFELQPDNAGTVAGIVARLDGLPLAIELAAARIRTLGPDELLERLDQRLPLLTGGMVDQAEHHQTMRDAIAWSYELLTGDEQSVLRDLSIFRGGFTLDAAARVAGRSALETIEIVDALVSQSLLRRTERHRHGRFAMLELVREYAREELRRRGEEQAAIERHAAVCVDLVRELEPVFEGRSPGDGQERLAPEIDNLRAALERAVAQGDAETSLELAARPWRFWQCNGQLTEGRSWAERALELSGGSITARARATAALGGLTYWQGDFVASRESYSRARDLYAATGDKAAETNAVYSLSLVATYEGELDAAERYAEEAMELARALGDESVVAEVLAAQFLVAWQKGELGRARGLAEATLEITRRLGLSAITATSLIGLAGIAFHAGDTDRALGLAAEALDLAIGIENTHTQLFALDAIASFSARRSPVESVRLSAAATALNKEHGGGWTLEVMGVEGARSAARELLAQDDLEAAWKDGADLELASALEVGRSILLASSTDAP